LESNILQNLWDRRDRLGIMAEIMEIARDGRLKTQIMYGVNLSFSQLKEYLLFLTEMGFLKVHIENRKRFYETTTKGVRYIENYKEMCSLLKTSNTVAHNFADVVAVESDQHLNSSTIM
jgi:predicted transcriptional regulator